MIGPRKTLLCLIGFSLISCPITAQKQANESEQKNYVKADVSLQASVSVKNQFIATSGSCAYRFGIFGLGGGIRTYFGLSLPENRIAPYLRLELGRFYLGGGPAFPAPQAPIDQGYVQAGTSVLITAGFAPVFVQLGPGRIGLDVSLDFLPTSHEVVTVDIPKDQGFIAYLFASIVVNAAANAAVFVMNTTKISIGATYSMAF